MTSLVMPSVFHRVFAFSKQRRDVVSRTTNMKFLFVLTLTGLSSSGYSAEFKVQFGGTGGFQSIYIDSTHIYLEGGWLTLPGCNFGTSMSFISYPDVATRSLFMTQLTFAMASGNKFKLLGSCVNHNQSTSRIDATGIITLVESASP